MRSTIRRAAILVFLASIFLHSGSPLFARPVHKQALAEYFGPFLARKLNDCRTCHVPDRADNTGASALENTEKPHNSFGARLKAVKDELRKAGKKTTIADRLQAIAEEDSDGDGVSNLLELLSGHFPGDPTDKPTVTEIAEARTTLAAFVAFQRAYPWRPFEPVKRAPLPHVKNTGWVRNPIDAFVAAEHEEHGLAPRPEAARTVLLRRLYLDLLGLPPTPDELHSFLADPSPEAYEKVVDHVLASPRYGERWGRHWMDVWRYSDWAGWGTQVRDSQPHIWHWRDWIVESLNADKGYDRMIVEMLAADEAAPEDAEALRATGYLVRNYKLLSRETWMREVVDHTAQAFLGVTLGCAGCHDHMFDTISQKEYYQVRAIFEPHQVRIDRLPGQPDAAKDGLPRAYDADLALKTFLFVRGDDRTPDKTASAPGVPEMLGGKFQVEPVKLPLAASCPDKRPFVVQETLNGSEKERNQLRQANQALRIKAAGLAVQTVAASPLQASARLCVVQHVVDHLLKRSDLSVAQAEAQWAALRAVLNAERLEEAGKKDSPPWLRAATEATTWQRLAALLQARLNLHVAQDNLRVGMEKQRAEAMKKVAEAEKALAKAEADVKLPPSSAYARRVTKEYPATSTGRRLAFARWITDRDNPLAARVAMNHIWLRHFGQAIVPSVFDFGRNGQRPSHPALLDWLAAEFMERSWSMKAMHRLMVTSNTYRMASTPDAANASRDGDNKYLWRMASRRMEAEVVRDCVFYVAGKLDLTMGGPDIDQNLGLTVPRRSLYFRHAQEKQMEFLKIFDVAAVTECYQRKQSILPQQALALANSELTQNHARLLAQTLTATAGADPVAFATAAFKHVLSRPPTAEESAECVAFLHQQTQRYAESNVIPTNGMDSCLRARVSLVHVLFNHHDFVTVH